MSEERWTWTVRVLAVVALVLLVVVTFEARTIRAARAEIEALRSERAHGIEAVQAQWARLAAADELIALRRLDAFIAEPTDGLGRSGGLCASGRLNDRAIADFAVAAFLTARGQGQSIERASETMLAAIRQTDEYRAVHPK